MFQCLSQRIDQEWVLPAHCPSVCLPMGLKPSHSIQELPTFTCYEWWVVSCVKLNPGSHSSVGIQTIAEKHKNPFHRKSQK